MPLIYQDWITRADLQQHPDWLFCFGDNMQRRGLGGQAREMRGEPNAVGIPTKHSPDNGPDAFFCDDDLHFRRRDSHSQQPPAAAIADSFARLVDHLLAGGVVVVPSAGIGTGLADLPNRAPVFHKLISDALKDLETL